MPRIVAANWKMNFSLQEVKEHTERCIPLFQQYAGVPVLLAVPFSYLTLVHHQTEHFSHVMVGAQDCSVFNPSGAYTGEISAFMLRSCGASFTIIGHSERRKWFSETSSVLRQKINHALQSGLDVIYCIGETLEERKQHRHFQVVEQQLTEVLDNLCVSEKCSLSIAYEPVWAIGTSVNATPEQAVEMHLFIRERLKKILPEHFARIPVLYGGSCNAANAKELFSSPGVDGGLIGGASLRADEFGKILDIASRL